MRNRTCFSIKHPKTYRSWSEMLQRCYNKRCRHYAGWGGRGITVCARWRENFLSFLEDMGERPEGRTLDRIDNNGNYCKENCRWATKEEQGNNTRSNRMLTFQGRTQNRTQWSHELGIAAATLTNRIDKLGWTVEEALSTPLSKPWGWKDKKQHDKNRKQTAVEACGKTQSIAEWSREFGLPYPVIAQRLKAGWEPSLAVTIPVFPRGQHVKPRKLYTVDGITKSAKYWAEHYGISEKTIYQRISRGMSAEQAIKNPVN